MTLKPTAPARLLVVEDDANIARLTCELLAEAGFDVRHAANCREALTLARAGERFSLGVFDWNLPDGDGLTLFRSLRTEGADFPVLFLTARTAVGDVVAAFEAGAVDYLTKPFHFRELLARIQVRLTSNASPGTVMSAAAAATASSAETSAPKRICSGAIEIDFDTCEARSAGVPIALTRLEFNLLRLFLEHPGKVFAREEILDRVWGENNYGTNRTVDTHVLQLRKKFGATRFETVWGFGYRLVANEVKE